jgi:hypothetical protein
VYIDVVEQRHDAPDQEQVGWNPLSVQVLRYPPEYTMTLQVLIENHTGENCIIVRTTKGIDAHTAGRTAEVAVHDPSVCAGYARNAESRMNLRTLHPMDQEYQRTT